MFKLHYRFCRLLFFLSGVIGLLPEARIFGQLTQLSGGQTRIVTNVQNGTTYTIPASDCGKLISFSNANSVAVTIPQAGSAGLPAGCWMDIQNIGLGTVTLTAVTSLIDQASSVQLAVNQGLRLVSTGAAYLTQRGQGQGSASQGSGAGTVTGTSGALISSALVTGNGGTDIKTPVAAATMDNGGNISIPGALATNSSCSGCAGAIDLLAGTDPGGQAANSFSWIAPQSIPSSFRWKLPSADSPGVIATDGASTPGTLSIVSTTGSGSIVRASSPLISRACALIFGSTGGTPLSTTQYQPQRDQCTVLQTGSVSLVIVYADAGAATVQLGYRHLGTVTALTPVLTPAVVSGSTDPVACANAGGTSITLEGRSVTCGTLSSTAVTQYDEFETIGGVADGTSAQLKITVIYQ